MPLEGRQDVPPSLLPFRKREKNYGGKSAETRRKVAAKAAPGRQSAVRKRVSRKHGKGGLPRSATQTQRRMRRRGRPLGSEKAFIFAQTSSFYRRLVFSSRAFVAGEPHSSSSPPHRTVLELLSSLPFRLLRRSVRETWRPALQKTPPGACCRSYSSSTSSLPPPFRPLGPRENARPSGSTRPASAGSSTVSAGARFRTVRNRTRPSTASPSSPPPEVREVFSPSGCVRRRFGA